LRFRFVASSFPVAFAPGENGPDRADEKRRYSRQKRPDDRFRRHNGGRQKKERDKRRAD